MGNRGLWGALAVLGLVVTACGGAGHGVHTSASPTTAGQLPVTPASSKLGAVATTVVPPSTTTASTTTANSTTTPVSSPPYPVTETTLPLVDTSRPTVAYGRQISPSRALTTLVWAPAVPGRWPLVVFAHGFEVGPTPYVGLLEHWAAAGFVVAAPEFPLTDQAIAGANLDENDINNQPADVRFVTDALVGVGSPLAARIDPARVALAGHSDGSETVLAASIAPTPPGEPAYDAVIVMSGQPVTTATSRNPPILVTQGDADTTNPPSNGYATYALASAPKYLEVLHGAEHLPPLQVGTPWYPALSGVTTAFLDYYVAGDGTRQSVIVAGDQPPYGSIQSA